MKESSSDFRDTLLELIDSSPAPADHPSPDSWLAYHRGELSSEAEASLHEHLVRCRACFDLSAAAAAFAQPEEEQGAGEEMETAAVWRLLRPQLDPPPANVREISASPRRQPAWKTRLPSTLAASFFVALVGLSAWTLHLQSDLDALRAPKPVHTVDFPSVERASTEKTLTGADAPWEFVFHPDGDLPAYRLTLHDLAAGGELGSSTLRPDVNLAVKLLLPEGLPPGRYRLELSDGTGGRAGEVLETHRLRVTEPGRGD